MKKLIFTLFSALVLIGCGGGGGGDNSGNSYSQNGMKLVSNDIKPGGKIPINLTADGLLESPHLKWSSVPSGTKGFFFIMDDVDANNYVHWNFFTADANLREIPRDASNTGTMPTSVDEGSNSAYGTGYEPPSPPKGESHKYRFCIYGLSKVNNTGIDLTVAYDNDTFSKQFKSITTGKACFYGYYY